MKKTGMIILGCLLVLGLAAGSLEASSITFNLDGVISGTGFTSSATSFGTVTLTDNGNAVAIDVQLANPSWKVLNLALNFNDAKFNNYSWFTLDNQSITVAENAVKQDGYPGKFDMVIPRNGNIGTYGSYTDTLRLNLGFSNIDPADFDFKDTANKVFASLHIGNYTKGSSIWVGASTDKPIPVSVPEPAVVFLIGAGIISQFLLRKQLVRVRS